jgi:hypothetical protein
LVSSHSLISALTKHRQWSLSVVAIGGRYQQKIRPVNTPSPRLCCPRLCCRGTANRL